MLALRQSARRRIRPVSALVPTRHSNNYRPSSSVLPATTTINVDVIGSSRHHHHVHHFQKKKLASPWILAGNDAPVTTTTSQRQYFSSSAEAANNVEIPASRTTDTTNSTDASSSLASKSSLSVEEQYSRKTPLEHILLRPGMYVGPCERLPPTTCWVLEPKNPPPPSLGIHVNNYGIETSQDTSHTNTTTEGNEVRDTTAADHNKMPYDFQHGFRMVQKECGIVPALVKIFDEILVNASDNRLRDTNHCSRLDVTIDPGSSCGSDGEGRPPSIRIFNDGKGIPIQIHKDENMYVPELVFGHLMSGSNFDDSTRRLTGGVHGLGAKLSNVFSSSFTVETLDSQTQQKYTQTWYNNMTESTAPEIVRVAPSETDYTSVTFVPDIPRLTGNPDQVAMDPQDYQIMCRRVVDVAGCHENFNVTLNGQDVSMSSFLDYSNLYRGEDASPLLFEEINDRWHVGVGLSESGNFESVSFVNGMATHRGGTHVNAVANQIIKRLQEYIEKTCDPDLAAAITPSLIRRNLFLSVRSLIENPNFDSQMKEYLTSSPDKFGSPYSLSKKFLKTTLIRPVDEGGAGIVEELIRVAEGRQQALLLREVGGKKTRRQLLSIPKLEDAHKAGSDFGKDCTLILTEGDSAKSLAVAGLEVIGRDLYGVFPLRGKFLNVREAKLSQLTNNAEVKALVSILGLDFDKEYDTVEERAELRYGHVMLMCDQDSDGSHIKGLVINFFRHFWPKLLKPASDRPLETLYDKDTFLSSFVTPLLKATRKGKKKEVLSFYSMAEYNEWRSSLEDPMDLNNWSIKYYKGLGTSTPAEAKEYFRAFDKHFRPFQWYSDLDGELVDMVFEKSGAAARRDWIAETYDPEIMLDGDKTAGNSVSYEDFINKEMIHFSNADNLRSLPHVVDGLKPSQRKVLYAAFKRKLTSEIKVAQLTGYCAEHTHYHHGEVSLQSTIIGLAQDFVGSNNINLLVPSGQFGTRLAGGKDAASPRYIFTRLSPICRYLFPEGDDVLLRYLEDDGQTIEPEYFCPILPMLLINGSQGIGTGWSTQIPPYDPEDILNYIIAKLDGVESLPPIRPYARGFEGKIEPLEDGRGFATYGRASKATRTSAIIDELPLRCWTDQYKQKLLKMRDRAEIAGFVEHHTTTKVSFEVKMKAVKLQRMMKSSGGLETAFKLKSVLATTNMNAFDADGVIQKFESAEQIAENYFKVRMALYHDRKSVLESELKHTSAIMKNKAKFITLVVDGEIGLVNGKQSKTEIVEKMKDLGLSSSSDLAKIRNDNAFFRRQAEEGPNDEAADKDSIDEVYETSSSMTEFDYLLNMPLSSLTSEKIVQLQEDAAKKEQDLEAMKESTPADLWRADLEKLAPYIHKLKQASI